MEKTEKTEGKPEQFGNQQTLSIRAELFLLEGGIVQRLPSRKVVLLDIIDP